MNMLSFFDNLDWDGHLLLQKFTFALKKGFQRNLDFIWFNKMKSSFPKRYKSILIVFMKITFFYLDPYILLIFNLAC